MNFRHVVGFSALCVGLGIASRASADGGPSSTLTENGSSSYTVLFSDQQLISDSGNFRLIMQGDGNLVEYPGCGSAVWSNGKGGTGGSDIDSPYVVFQNDGNFVEYGWQGEAIWGTNHTFDGGGSLRLQDDGNIVIYPYSGGVAFASGTRAGAPDCGGQASYTTMLPGRIGTGNSWKTLALNNFAECGNTCAQESECVAFDWFQPVADAEYDCNLYNSIPALASNAAFSVGIVTRVNPDGK